MASQEVEKFTIGNRSYELVPSLKEGEDELKGKWILRRAKKLNANLGREDGLFILNHQLEIPPEFRGRFSMVFTNWRNPSNPLDVVCLSWNGSFWCKCWLGVHGWYEGDWLVRRRPATNPAS